MGRWLSSIILVIVVAVSVAAPIYLSLYLVHRQSYMEQVDQARLFADDILRRTDKTTDQIYMAVNALKVSGTANPCSSANIQRMSSLAMNDEELQALGYVHEDMLICSSIGGFDTDIEVGPPDYKRITGWEVRTAVPFPFVTKKEFILVTEPGGGYTAIVDPDIELDISSDKPGISVGVFNYSNRYPLLQRGDFRAAWMRAAPARGEVVINDGTSFVVIQHSRKYDYCAYASIPSAMLVASMFRVALILVPIGILAAILLVACVLYLARQQTTVPALIKAGLRRGEFYLNYQPTVDLRTGDWVGAEALIRWKRWEGRIVPPDQFIPAAEAAGLSTRITEHVVHLVIKDVGNFFDLYPQFHLGINFTAADLHSERTIAMVQQIVESTSARPHNLLVEATERELMNVGRAYSVISALRESGVKVAIDDFGTGYSSLSYLNRLELDLLKIDKSFVDAIGTDAVTNQVVAHIIDMACDLKLEIIAEGVENESQIEYLRAKNVQYAQGYFFSRPLSFEELKTQLAVRSKAAVSA